MDQNRKVSKKQILIKIRAGRLGGLLWTGMATRHALTTIPLGVVRIQGVLILILVRIPVVMLSTRPWNVLEKARVSKSNNFLPARL